MLSSHSTPYHVAFGSFVDVATGPTYLIVPRKSLSSRILVPTKLCGGPFVASRSAAIYLSFFSAGLALFEFLLDGNGAQRCSCTGASQLKSAGSAVIWRVRGLELQNLIQLAYV